MHSSTLSGSGPVEGGPSPLSSSDSGLPIQHVSECLAGGSEGNPLTNLPELEAPWTIKRTGYASRVEE